MMFAVALLACVGFIGICFWLYAAGHLDQVEHPDLPRVAEPPTARSVWSGLRRSLSASPEEKKRIRAAIAEWRGHPSTRPTANRPTLVDPYRGQASGPSGYGRPRRTSEPS